MKYTRKPQPKDLIDAVQWNGSNLDEIKAFFTGTITEPSNAKNWEGMIVIDAPESTYGYYQLHIGWWIYKTTEGRYLTMTGEHFAKIYKPI